ncbi:MAG: substrate-binding domain-containing protein, partial [Candidatus Hydrogenedentota bacterium]
MNREPGTIGFLIEETEHFLRSDVFCAPIALAIESRLSEAGHRMRLINPVTPLDDIESLQGIIYMQAKSSSLYQELIRKLPVVALLPDTSEVLAASIVVDDDACGRIAAEKMRSGPGMKYVAASGEEENGTIPVPYRRRVEGFTETIRTAGGAVQLLTAPFHHVAGTSGATASRPVGDKIGLILLSQSERPAGVFAVNDYIADEIVQWFRSSNVSVPQEVQVIGCDNLPTRNSDISTVHVSK